ncbi:MAG: DUF2169 family type VI secretion system accessory protein [Polyangiales bacterium]
MRWVTRSPVSVGHLSWSTASGARRSTLVMKATFALVPDGVARLIEPRALSIDLHHEANLSRSLRTAADLVPRKVRADVLVEASAWAPPGEEVRAMDVRLVVGDALDKTLRVTGEPFRSLPIRYELAYGGASSKINPVGVGADKSDTRAPSIVDPNHERRVAGLGPVPWTWWWRRRVVGDESPPWVQSFEGVPDDVDESVFQAAPPDQQLAALKGDETIELHGMHPAHAIVRTRLPGIELKARLDGEPLPFRLDTLAIDADALVATLTFRCEREELPEGAVVEIDGPSLDEREEKAEPAPAEIPAPKLPSRTTETVPIVNGTKLVAFTVPFQVKPPQDSLTVVVKGTFDLRRGEEATLSEVQELASGDLAFEDGKGVRYPSDFAPFKPRCDVTLVGHVSAHNTVARVKLGVGSLQRTLAVIGDRQWSRDGSATEPRLVDRIPLRWERAFASDENPVGRGQVMLPNLERDDALVRAPGDAPRPICFAPIPREWRARRRHLGTYDARWLARRWPWFPEDFDWSYFNAAPSELQIPYLEGGERWLLSGLDDERTVEGTLPRLRPRVIAERTDGSSVEVLLRIDTLWIDGDAMRAVLVFRGFLPVQDDEASDVARLVVTIDGSSPVIEERKMPERAPRRVVAPPKPMRRADLERLLAAGGSLAGRDLSFVNASGLDFRERDLTGTIFTGAQLQEARFEKARLARAVLVDVDASRIRFDGAVLDDADLGGARFDGGSFVSASLGRVVADGASFTGAELSGVRATAASFVGANLGDACLDGAKLDRAHFSDACIERATFRKAVLDDARLYRVRGEGADLDGASLVDARLDEANLSRARGALRAPGATFERAVLTEVSFSRSDFRGAVFARAALDRARLEGVDAIDATFRKASLRGASFVGSNLMRVRFERADLRGCDFARANLYQSETWRART